MNKGIKTLAISLFIMVCVLCIPSYSFAKKAPKEAKAPKSTTYTPMKKRFLEYNDDMKEYQVQKKNGKRKKQAAANTNIMQVAGAWDETQNEENVSDTVFTAPYGKYEKYYSVDGTVGINYIKYRYRDFE